MTKERIVDAEIGESRCGVQVVRFLQRVMNN